MTTLGTGALKLAGECTPLRFFKKGELIKGILGGGDKELNIENEWGLFWVTPFIDRNYNKDNMQISFLMCINIS